MSNPLNLSEAPDLINKTIKKIMFKEGTIRYHKGFKQIYTPEGKWKTIGSTYRKIPTDTGWIIKQTIKGLPEAAKKVISYLPKSTIEDLKRYRDIQAKRILQKK